MPKFELSIFDKIFIQINIWFEHKMRYISQTCTFRPFCRLLIQWYWLHFHFGVLFIALHFNLMAIHSKWIGFEQSTLKQKGSCQFMQCTPYIRRQNDSSYLIKPFWNNSPYQNLCFQFAPRSCALVEELFFELFVVKVKIEYFQQQFVCNNFQWNFLLTIFDYIERLLKVFSHFLLFFRIDE